jgi:predicted nucleic acid-binding protein
MGAYRSGRRIVVGAPSPIGSLRRLWASDKRLTVIPASHDLFEIGLDRFCSRADKEWSLTDCISFVVMEQRGIYEAFTGDHHFEQAGFVPLLK